MRASNQSALIKILGVRIDAVGYEEILSLIEKTIRGNLFLQIVTVNALMILEAEKDVELADILQGPVLAVPESAGISIACRLKGYPSIQRIPGIDLMLCICGKAEKNGWPVALLGSTAENLALAKNNLHERYPKLEISGTSHGYFDPLEEKKIIEDIEGSGSRIVFVGTGMPRQEKWIHQNLARMKGLCAMGVGGSFDVISGQLRRAPQWMQKTGIEWLYRLLQEPRRFRRIQSLPRYIFKVLIDHKEPKK